MAKLRAGIHAVNDDGKPELRCGFEWRGDGDSVQIITGADSGLAKAIQAEGVRVGGRAYTLDDGEVFMRWLPWVIRGSMLYADLWEEKDGKWVPVASENPPELVGEQGESNA